MIQQRHSFSISTPSGVRMSGFLNILFECSACKSAIFGLMRLNADGTSSLSLGQDYHQPKLSQHKLSLEAIECGNALILCECFVCPAPESSPESKKNSLESIGTSSLKERSTFRAACASCGSFDGHVKNCRNEWRNR